MKPERLLRLHEVIHRTGMCRAKIYRLEGFPKPIKVGGKTSAWVESEVDAWIQMTIEAGRSARKTNGLDFSNGVVGKYAGKITKNPTTTKTTTTTSTPRGILT
jgi:prophage regulatory protein